MTHSAADEPSLSLTSRTNRGGYVIAALSGDLGAESGPALREQILGLLRAASHLIIDLSAVEHADASGLATLVGSGRRARLLGGTLRLAAPSPEVARVLSASGMNRHLDIFPTIRAAITGQSKLPGPIFPAGSYEQRPTRPSAVTAGRQASGHAGRRDVWSRPGQDLVVRARASGWSARLFLNGPAHGSQMIAETQGRGPLALGQVAVELHLTAQGDTCAELSGLAPLGVADRLGQGEDFPGAAGWDEQHAIVIAQDQVLPIHGPISHRGGRQRIEDPGIETLRAGRDRSQAEDRQPDRLDVGGVAMQSPDHDSVQPRSLSLQDHQVADATLIEAPVVVGHQHLARCGPFERLEEDINAAGMPGRTHPPSQPATGHDRMHARRRAAHRELSADACIGQMGSGQRRKPVP